MKSISGGTALRPAALALLLFTVITRLPALTHPQPIDDEEVYAIVANEIADGGLPYVDAVERKPPLLFWTYAGVFAAAGKYNWPALHFVALGWTLATMLGLYVIGHRLFNRTSGFMAALLYAAFQPWASWKNLAFNGEVLMNLPLVWAWAIALRQGHSRIRPELFAAGILIGAASLLKQPAGIAGAALGIYLLLPAYRASRGLSLPACLVQGAMLAAGFLCALGVVGTILYQQGILGEAVYWSVSNHSLHYFFWDRALIFTGAFLLSCLPLIVGLILAIRDRQHLWQERRAERIGLFVLLVASAIGVAAGGRFYPHYYIQAILPLVLLAAPHYAALWADQAGSPLLLRRPVMLGWLGLTTIVFSTIHWTGLWPQRQDTETARYLLAHSKPEDRIFVWGQKPKIYLQAQRRPACRYILTFPLTGYIFGGALPGLDTRPWIVPGAWDALERDFRQHPPKYIIDAEADTDSDYPLANFPILSQLVAQQYELVTETHEGRIYRIHAGGSLF